MDNEPRLSFCTLNSDGYLYEVEGMDPNLIDPWIVLEIAGECTGMTAYYGLNSKRQLFEIIPTPRLVNTAETALGQYKMEYAIGDELPPHLVDGQILETMERALGFNE